MDDPDYPGELGRMQSFVTLGMPDPGKTSGYMLVVASKGTPAGGEQLPAKNRLAYGSAIGTQERPNCVFTALHALNTSIKQVNGGVIGPVDIWAIRAADFYHLPDKQKANVSGLAELGAVKALGHRSRAKMPARAEDPAIPYNNDWAVVVLAGPIKLYRRHPRLLSESQAKQFHDHLKALAENWRATVEVLIEGSGAKYTIGPKKFGEGASRQCYLVSLSTTRKPHKDNSVLIPDSLMMRVSLIRKTLTDWVKEVIFVKSNVAENAGR
jgi:hypothetical protein